MLKLLGLNELQIKLIWKRDIKDKQVDFECKY